jgi:hypothetical protein
MPHYEACALRLMVAFEAEALIANFGGEAYSIARRRAEEASSETLGRDWSEVARMIARKTCGRRWGSRVLQSLALCGRPSFATAY